jgi:hypothetical protein
MGIKFTADASGVQRAVAGMAKNTERQFAGIGKFSPPAWGWSVRAQRLRSGDGVLPTRVGMVRELQDAINAATWIKDADFWKDELIDSDIGSLAMPLSVCMKELGSAINGDVYSIGVILSMLAQIEKSALPRAEEQLIDIYGSD